MRKAPTAFAVTTMLSHNSTPDTIEKMMIANSRLPTEMQVVTLKDIYKRSPELKKYPVVKEWTTKNANILFGN